MKMMDGAEVSRFIRLIYAGGKAMFFFATDENSKLRIVYDIFSMISVMVPS
jgi:hypothetical protein